jgi:transposase
LIEIGTFDRSLFDETNLAEVTSDDYPDERLIACHNPILEMRRQKKREELLVTTEKKLTKLSQQISKRADKNKPFTEAEIGVRVGKIVDKHKVAKHFEITIENGRFSFQRNSESIQQESELDGIYVIRTNVSSEERTASDVVRDYKRLADVEKGFRTIKTTLLDIRPIHHHLEKRVRAHFLICMLSYYVVWHLRQAWAPYLFCDENLDETRATRNPVVAATPNENVNYKKSKNAKINFKKLSKNNNNETNNEEHRVESFQSLLNNLATICQNNCRIINEKNITFENHTTPTNFQENLINKIKAIKTTKN